MKHPHELKDNKGVIAELAETQQTYQSPMGQNPKLSDSQTDFKVVAKISKPMYLEVKLKFLTIPHSTEKLCAHTASK